MKRWSSLLVVLAAWPLLTAGGGINPPPCLDINSPTCGYAVRGPSVSVSVFLDPHNAAGDFFSFFDVTPSARQSVITFGGKSQDTAPYAFKALPSFPFLHGCDVSLTNARFLFTFQHRANLPEWVPSFALQSLLQQVGAVSSPGSPVNIPVFTSISNARCIADPSAPTTLDGSAPGFLAFDATIQFLQVQ